MESDELVNDLAEYTHLTWAGWMDYLFKKSVTNDDGSVTIPKDLVDRWKRQMNTDYKYLSDEEVASDKSEAYRIISLFIAFLDRQS